MPKTIPEPSSPHMPTPTPESTEPTEEAVKRKIAKRIRSARQARGISKAELARRSGVSNSAIMRWEEEINEPPIHRLMQVARELDYSLGWFLQDLDPGIETALNLSGEVFPVQEEDRAEQAVRLKDLVMEASEVQIMVSVKGRGEAS